MKVVTPSNDKGQHGQTKKPPILPILLDMEEDKALKENLHTFEIYSIPGDNTSIKYKMTVRRLAGNESLRTAISWLKDLQKLHEGLGLKGDTPNQIRITKQILKNQPLIAFELGITHGATKEQQKAAIAAREAEADPAQKDAAYKAEMDKDLSDFYNGIAFTTGINALIRHYAPAKALQRVKRYLRREQRKPAGMKVRQYLNHLLRVNYEEIPYLPPFKGPSQSLPDDELVEIITFACPKSWIREMDRQGKDPVDMTPWEVVDFLEQIESSEDFDNDKTKQTAKKSKKDAKGKRNGGGKYCSIHGNGNHTTEECRTIKSHIEKAKSGGKSPNKTWNRKADDAKKAAKKELAAFVKKKVEEEMNAAEEAKKRKADEESDSTDEEVNAIEERVSDIDLQEFNYDNINVDDIDEIST